MKVKCLFLDYNFIELLSLLRAVLFSVITLLDLDLL